MANADYKVIMLKAKTKYDMLLSNKDRTCGTPKAKLEQFKDSNLKLPKLLKSKLKTSSGSASNAKKINSASNTVRTFNQTTRNQKNTSNRRRQKQDEVWKKTAPKSGEPKTIKKDNKTWHWCIHHLAWCLHSSEECRKAKDMDKSPVSNQSSSSDSNDVDCRIGPNKQLLAHLAELSIQDK